jgi:hypothetical protein
MEIASEISSHMIKGLMFHSQMADYYKFLGLSKYSECHENHYKKEDCAWRKFSNYVIEHYNKLIPEKEIESPDAIPQSWYDYSRQDVDAGTKSKAVKAGLEKWLEWETETKTLYQNMFYELLMMKEVAFAMHLKHYIKDVDCEITDVTQYQLNKSSVGYDIGVIISEQHHYK